MRNTQTIEVKGSDVEAAITKGLADLNASRDDVTIEILDEGSRGLFGLGGRPAVVRLTLQTVQEPAPVVAAAPPAPAPVAPPPPKPAPVVAAPKPRPAVETPKPKPVVTTPPPSYTQPDHEDDDTSSDEPELTEADIQAEGETALEVINTILDYISVHANTELSLSEPDDLTGRRINMINITGNDLGTLIGPRGETLDSLQFISRLMVGHQLQRKATFTLDVESYRQRRKEALARLAERMARKVTKQRRPVTLEPMPPHERRAVHMALRNFKGVYTQSTGTGDRRRVRIYPER